MVYPLGSVNREGKGVPCERGEYHVKQHRLYKDSKFDFSGVFPFASCMKSVFFCFASFVLRTLDFREVGL